MILSLITPTAAVDGTLSVSVTPQPVHVGDTVYITVTASNEGIDDWEQLMIKVPIPSGLKYVSHVVPDRTMQDYTQSTEYGMFFR